MTPPDAVQESEYDELLFAVRRSVRYHRHRERFLYVVNGRTPLEWFIDRYRVTRDRESGIVDDPNGWFSKPDDLVTAIRRIVHVSVETVRIVAGLPQPFAEPSSSQRGGALARSGRRGRLVNQSDLVRSKRPF